MPGTEDADETDILILGGGSSGALLASRLSEDGGTRVHLVEAGADIEPPECRSAYPGRAYFDRRFIWGELRVRLGARAPHDSLYEQARILGGGSAINGLGLNRGAPDDYDEWEAAGATGWGWANVLPVFRGLEADRDFGADTALHGASGPLPIRRSPERDWPGFAAAAASAFAAAGHARRDDQNGAWEDGIFATAVGLGDDGTRVSCARAFLGPSVRARHNLRIAPDSIARRLLVSGGRVVGARVLGVDGVERDVRARRETVVACGALNTPALLLRSGIGPADELRALGIEVVADRAGVGRNLQEHPGIGVSAWLRPRARLRAEGRHHLPLLLRYSSGQEGGMPGDMHVAVIARSAWHGVGSRIGTLSVWVNKVHSRGAVRLAGPEPWRLPTVRFDLLADERDRARLRDGFRRLAAFWTSAPLAAAASFPFASAYSDRVRRAAKGGARNAALLAAAGAVLDGMPRAWREAALRGLVAGGPPLVELLRSAAVLDAFLDRSVFGIWHPAGTCRMGRGDDPGAVTSPEGRVYGVAGLRIADASLMPTLPRANTNLPVMMMAERIAAAIRATTSS